MNARRPARQWRKPYTRTYFDERAREQDRPIKRSGRGLVNFHDSRHRQKPRMPTNSLAVLWRGTLLYFQESRRLFLCPLITMRPAFEHVRRAARRHLPSRVDRPSCSYIGTTHRSSISLPASMKQRSSCRFACVSQAIDNINCIAMLDILSSNLWNLFNYTLIRVITWL